MHHVTRVALILVGAAALACGGDDLPAAPDAAVLPQHPADYADTFVEVGDCRRSAHSFHFVRTFADPDLALVPYRDHEGPFPTGALLVMEEYDLADITCSGDLIGWSTMKKLAEGASPEAHDWNWQGVTASGEVDSENRAYCWGCHVFYDCDGDETRFYFATCGGG